MDLTSLNYGSFNIGLLGGSFDPVHNAHVQLAVNAYKHLKLDYVYLLPAYAPWQKGKLSVSAYDRVKMLRMAISNYPFLKVSNIEIARGGTTYTIDTIKSLPSNNNYYWIMGTDQLANFCSWHKWEEMVNMVTFAVAQRPGSSKSVPVQLEHKLSVYKKRILYIPFNPTEISSTNIREYLASGDYNKALQALDPTVLKYIKDNGLYVN